MGPLDLPYIADYVATAVLLAALFALCSHKPLAILQQSGYKNKKMLAFVAVYGYDEDAVEAATVKVRHLKMLLTSKEELPIINVNVTLALSPEQVILPIYPTADDSQLSTPVDIEDLVNDGKIKGCKLFHFD